MAVLGRTLFSSSERLDLTDILSIESYLLKDFSKLLETMTGGTTPYILKGFDVIQPKDAIATENVSIRVADSVAYYPGSAAGPFYFGLPDGNEQSVPLIPELRKNSTNFVYLTFSTFDTAKDGRAFWDVDQNGGAGGEFSQDVNTESALKVEVNVSVSSFPENTIPVAKVVVGPSVITSIEDSRNMMFRLGTGGTVPNPFATYNFRDEPSAPFARSEPASIMTNAAQPNPFEGGDKNIETLKEWMDAVMTRIKELSGGTYWYDATTNTPNVQNTFLDGQGSTIKSKGEWLHDGIVSGRITWTEDIQLLSLIDPRQTIFRSSTIDLSNDDTVAYVDLIRDADINTTGQTVDWTNGSNIVNGIVGAFSNVSKGDWIKQGGDDNVLYLRVEELYADPNLAGSATSGSLAQSIKLSNNYAGTSGSFLSVYTKGEYLQTDIQIDSRDSAAIGATGGNFFWLAARSDTILTQASIARTDLTIDISGSNGTKAQVDSVGHGLEDGDRVTIVAPSAFAGTYQVEVENVDRFFIQTSVIAADEAGSTAHYAIITTGARSTADGYALETANHTFESNQRIIIADTTSGYDGSYLINVRGPTQIQIPVGSAIVPPVNNTGTVTLPRVNVRTEFGIVKVVQGEAIDIGDVDTSNILDYIGMPSLAQSAPSYSVPSNYNAKDGQSDYNSDPTDDLTTRTAKLTAMMADRVQERGFSFKGRVSVTSNTNGINQDISSNAPLILYKPGSPDQSIDLTVALPENSVAIADLDRDSSSAIVLSVESIGSPTLIGENKLILFYRYTGTDIYDWNNTLISPNDYFNTGKPEDSQNRNIIFNMPGSVRFNGASGTLTLDVPKVSEVSAVQTVAGNAVAAASFFNISSAKDTTAYYVWYRVDGVGADPAPGGTGIQVNISSVNTAEDVASATAVAISGSVDFNATASSNIVTISNVGVGPSQDVTDGATATTFVFSIVCQGLDEDPKIIIPGSVNDNTIDTNTLSSFTVPADSSAWIRVNRYAAKIFNNVQSDPTVVDSDVNGSIYITNTNDVPVDQDVFVLFTRIGDNLVQHHIAEQPDANIYEESIEVVAGVPANNFELQGPVAVNTQVNMPEDTRDSNSAQTYVVGAGHLEVYLNGQFIVLGRDWQEVGPTDCESSKIEMLQPLVVGDILTFRLDAHGGVYFSSAGFGGAGGSSSLQGAYNGGRTISVNSGQPMVISGPPGQKLLVIQGDLDVTGVIDPIGLEFTPVALNPLSGPGLWINGSNELIYENGTTATNLTGGLLRTDGSIAMSGHFDVGNNRIVNLSAPIDPDDATSKNYVDTNYFRVDGTVPLGGNINANGNQIENLQDPNDAQDAATKNYVDVELTNYVKTDGTNPLTGNLDGGSQRIINIADPVDQQDVATKEYVDANSNLAGAFGTYQNVSGVTILAGDAVVASKTIAKGILLANSSALGGTDAFIGIATENIGIGATGLIQNAGEATANGLSSFSVGEEVFISTTDGKLTDTAPSVIGSAVLVAGIATSANTLVLKSYAATTNDSAFEESYTIVAAPSGTYELAPQTAPANITLPGNSRAAGSPGGTYTVGTGDLQIILNGQVLTRGTDYNEVGGIGTNSTQIEILQDLVLGDIFTFRDTQRSQILLASGGGSVAAMNDLLDVSAATPANDDVLVFNGVLNRWENSPRNNGDIRTASNVGTGAGEVFKQKTGNDLEFRNIQAGSGVTVTPTGDNIVIAADKSGTHFVEFQGTIGDLTPRLGASYQMHSNMLDVYKNGLRMMHSSFLGVPADRYMEFTNNSIQLAEPLLANEVIGIVGKEESPSYITYLTGQNSTNIKVPSYILGNNSLQVWRNGVLLQNTVIGDPIDRYSEANATTILLGQTADPSDIFIIVRNTAAPTSRTNTTGLTATVISPIPPYTLGTGSLLVYKNGLLMTNSTTLSTVDNRYQETSSTSITLAQPAIASDIFTFIVK